MQDHDQQYDHQYADNSDQEPDTPYTPLNISTLADITSRQVSWLWPHRIPHARLTIMAGDPGVGKSLLSLDIAARLTTGRDWPDGSPSTGAAGVIIISGDDDPADTIRPRLDAMEADLSRVHIIGDTLTYYGGRTAPMSLVDHISLIIKAIQTHRASLLIIDPLLAFAARRANTTIASKPRPLFTILSEAARAADCAILGIMHLNKRSFGGGVLNRLAASPDFAASARSVILVGHSPLDPYSRIMVQAKSNLAYMPRSIEFCFLGDGSVDWIGEVPASAAELLEGTPQTAKAIQTARRFLQEILADGPLPATEVLKEAAELGISPATLFRARTKLHIQALRQNSDNNSRGNGRWMLSLP